MSREVSFTIATDADKEDFKALASSRGLSLAQFARWCLYKYRLDCQTAALASRAYRAQKRPEKGSSTVDTEIAK